MNIAIIGATGKTGMSFAKQALDHGHCVTALVRSPEKVTLTHHHLRVIPGDVMNIDDVKRAVLGQDAIFIALGTGETPKKSSIREAGTRQVMDVLQQAKETPQVVVLSSLGVGDSSKQIPFHLRWFVKLMLMFPLADHKKQEAIVTSSQVPYTILRPTSMHDIPATGHLHVTTSKDMLPIRPAVSPDDVAQVAVAVIEGSEYQNQVITLTHQG